MSLALEKSSGNCGEATSLRILFAGELWNGSDSYAYVRALRRAGHSVTAIESANFMPTGWRSKWLRGLRRFLEPWLIAEYERELIDMARHLSPQLFIGFKANYVTPAAMHAIKETGAVAINVYPDVSFMAHGPRLPKTLPLYDWVFTTKTFGLKDLESTLGVRSASFFPPAYDPEVHTIVALDSADQALYQADVSFVGTWQLKNEQLLSALQTAAPNATIKIWGGDWHKATAPNLRSAIQHKTVLGLEYSKCVRASRINLSPMRDRQVGASSGDLITHRTFAMPACGGFMLHERTPEITDYFIEGKECALYSDTDDFIAKARYYLEHEYERARVAEAGRARALRSGYSVDARVQEVLSRFEIIAAQKRRSSGVSESDDPFNRGTG
ncbi:CgeB family protein [Methylocystis hirsuta]|uniref:Spore protein YkvP/CgeB glycosyl transferase-like domain-containing protein n=1 Tax=Methylocystis hirsuta TaxID=369798 RepID=A0A3M9XLH8_9HYPH|nr:glycosyltransferase [Methylocystis hirsuta]RNJ48676.1 hypothetical protein D1O30_02550 [Methylocystis hirsuta]